MTKNCPSLFVINLYYFMVAVARIVEMFALLLGIANF